ncbi:MAG: hypothetical protein MR017_08465 [Paraprevotella sp.]|nr:hypothetical protein [Paraprevotella sp.]
MITLSSLDAGRLPLYSGRYRDCMHLRGYPLCNEVVNMNFSFLFRTCCKPMWK